jgi:hypothetical protein
MPDDTDTKIFSNECLHETTKNVSTIVIFPELSQASEGLETNKAYTLRSINNNLDTTSYIKYRNTRVLDTANLKYFENEFVSLYFV